jgi:hypothetical protein
VKVQQEVWQRVRQGAQTILTGTTLRALLDRQSQLTLAPRYAI